MLSVDVPIQWLRLLRLGDVWESGRRRGSIDLERKTFQRLKIDQDSARVVRCGLSTQASEAGLRHELPFGLFKNHVDHTRAYVVRVQVQKNLVLLIPSMEAIRFYFGSSGSLLANIFSGYFAKDLLFHSAERNATTGVASIQLAKGVPAMAASTVGRIAFDSSARRQFRYIVNTGVKAAAGHEPWYPLCGIPLIGETDLTVEGVWIDRTPDRVFIVNRVISCTHPFPFSKLFYKTDAETISKLVSASEDGGKGDAEITRSSGVAIREGAQDAALVPAVVSGVLDEALVAFPDLINKQIARVRSQATKGGLASPKPSSCAAQPIDLRLGLNRAGAARSADVSDSLEPQDSGFAEPIVLRELRRAAELHLPEIVRATSPLDSALPSSRLVVHTGDGVAAGIWVSRFDVSDGESHVRSIVIMCLEAQTSEGEPELLDFQTNEAHIIDGVLLAEMALLFWAIKKEDPALAEKFGLVRSWSSLALACAEAPQLLLMLLDRALDPEFGAEGGAPSPDDGRNGFR